MADYENGMTRKQMLKRWGRTLELVYDHQCDQQQPGFKSSMKALVRRALTARVGWVKLGYRRKGDTYNSTQMQANTPELLKTIAQKLNEAAADEDGEEQLRARLDAQAMLQSLQQGVATGSAQSWAGLIGEWLQPVLQPALQGLLQGRGRNTDRGW